MNLSSHIREPEVSVFMAVYNGKKYLKDAISSVLKQSFKDFELLIINDGSTDNSVEIIKSFSDPRIRLLHNDRRRGLFYTRNRGIEESKGNYFATLDCDDIATSHRLMYQVKFLFKHPDYVMCGGQGKIINEGSNVIGRIDAPVGSSEFIKVMCLFSNPFINSATVIRKDALKEIVFRANYEPAEDYDLFQRITMRYKAANLKRDLVHYRLHGSNISVRKMESRILAEREIIKRQLVLLGAEEDERNLDLHYCFISRKFTQVGTLDVFENWLLHLYRLNMKNRCYPVADFKKALFYQWEKLSYAFKGRYALWMNPFAPIVRIQGLGLLTNVFLEKLRKKATLNHG